MLVAMVQGLWQQQWSMAMQSEQGILAKVPDIDIDTHTGHRLVRYVTGTILY